MATLHAAFCMLGVFNIRHPSVEAPVPVNISGWIGLSIGCCLWFSPRILTEPLY
jgi:hypothetical protein